ncbi:metallophosphoesterase family protein [Pengzhenrongella sicca]|uniref:Metallophosphoesterase n=1 Tax=Pengzhenrongella sicca TaxID=2819238 RepID=A0A8A4Z9E8_9MICO|nr:metallophosphoesterase [Pengzhenrongella sicca]QTE28502.1 metallophosphoesterase [Pengzhenrongella sicca]
MRFRALAQSWRESLGRGWRGIGGWARRVRWGRAALVGLVVLVGALTFGVTTASTQSSLGPHEARYEVTTDDLVTLDLGPLGTLQIDSPLPLTFGARVTVEEIPADVRAVDAARTIEALGSDLQSYVQFFSAPQVSITDAARALVVNAALRTLSALVAVALLVAVGRVLLGTPRRAELAAGLAPRRRPLIGGALLALAVATTAVSSLNPSERGLTGRAASSVFDGTPLEGARITGRLAGVIDTYGGEVVKAYRANTDFYAGADDALETAWADRAAGTRAREEARALLQGEPLAPAAPTPTPATEDEAPIVALLVSDLHCNVGMAPLIGSAAALADVDLVLDGGDSTINGTAVEQYCITTFAAAVPAGIPVVVAGGNHDSSETSAQERRAGFTVLDGGPVTVAGLRILGDTDPSQTRVGGGTSLSGAESATEVGARLAQTACDDGEIDLLLIHTPTVGQAALDSGCVPLQLSGHRHVRYGPEASGEGVRFTSASTAGAAPGQPTVGPLKGTAEMTVLRFDPDTRRAIDYQLIEVRPDGTASVGYPVPFPRPVEPVVDDDGSLADQRPASPVG